MVATPEQFSSKSKEYKNECTSKRRHRSDFAFINRHQKIKTVCKSALLHTYKHTHMHTYSTHIHTLTHRHIRTLSISLPPHSPLSVARAAIFWFDLQHQLSCRETHTHTHSHSHSHFLSIAPSPTQLQLHTIAPPPSSISTSFFRPCSLLVTCLAPLSLSLSFSLSLSL